MEHFAGHQHCIRAGAEWATRLAKRWQRFGQFGVIPDSPAICRDLKLARSNFDRWRRILAIQTGESSETPSAAIVPLHVVAEPPVPEPPPLKKRKGHGRRRKPYTQFDMTAGRRHELPKAFLAGYRGRSRRWRSSAPCTPSSVTSRWNGRSRAKSSPTPTWCGGGRRGPGRSSPRSRTGCNVTIAPQPRRACSAKPSDTLGTSGLLSSGISTTRGSISTTGPPSGIHPQAIGRAIADIE